MNILKNSIIKCSRLFQPIGTLQNQSRQNPALISDILSRPTISYNIIARLCSVPQKATVIWPQPAAQVDDISEPDELYRRIELELRSVEPAVLRSYHTFISSTAKHLDIQEGHTTIPPKYTLKRWNALKSKFVHRKHIVQYEVRTHHRILRFLHLTGSTADTFLEYIQRNIPEGVAMKVCRIRMEALPDQFKQPPKEENAECEGSNSASENKQ